jgi:hypothetical protein
MITSVIVQIGHGNRVGEREREGEGETKGKKEVLIKQNRERRMN